jgi:hypothetical protein
MAAAEFAVSGLMARAVFDAGLIAPETDGPAVAEPPAIER